MATGSVAAQAIERRHIKRLLSVIVREVRRNNLAAPAHARYTRKTDDERAAMVEGMF